MLFCGGKQTSNEDSGNNPEMSPLLGTSLFNNNHSSVKATLSPAYLPELRFDLALVFV